MSVNKSKLTKSIQNRGNYSIVPNEIWSMPISKSAKIVYVYIISQSDSWNPGSREIAEGTSSSKSTVLSALRELEKSNMIEIESAPSGLRNVYSIQGVDEWNCTAGPLLDRSSFSPPVGQSKPTSGLKEAHIQEESKKNLRREISNQTPSFKDEEEIQIDLTMDFTPTASPKISSPENVRIVAEPKVEVSAEAILAKWKPSKVDHKELESILGDLFTTLKHYSVPKDELSTKKILKSIFGPSPHKKIAWLVEKAEVLIDEQRELIYASEDLNIISSPTASKEMFDLLPGALPYLEDLRARGITPADLNGMSLIEHANNRAYSDQFTAIPYKKEQK